MAAFRDELQEHLERLADEGLRRELITPRGVDFSSNDYLGLARDPQLREQVLARLAAMDGDAPLGAPASRLLRGHLPVHERLEQRLASYKGTEAALIFSTGYQANLGVLTALIRPQDRVLSDELNHASIVDGLRLSGARKVIFPHLDVDTLERELRRPHADGRTFIVSESLFSMDGDVAPLDRYAGLAEHHGALLVVDDAHATGVFGAERGSGLVEEFGVADRVEAVVSTFGKALGLFGACVAGPRVVIDWLVQRARSFVYTTAPPPLLVCAIEAALTRAGELTEVRARVLALAARLRTGLLGAGLTVRGVRGPIVPLVLGDNRLAVEAAAAVQRRGFDVRAIRPPSVPEGTARLRISVHAHNSEAEVDGLIDALRATLRSDSTAQVGS